MANYNAIKSEGAINPYNFVSYNGEVERDKQVIGENSGVIHCILKTTTPLAMPDLPISKKIEVYNNNRQQQHTESEFYKVNGKPVIPGSEIRGVIRSAYETLSNSCFSVNNNNILSARSSDIREPGILKYGEDKKWHLYKAISEKLKYDSSENFDETKDTFKRTWKNYKYKNRIADYKGGKIEVGYKFTKTSEEVMVKEFDEAIKDYIEVCEIYLKKNPDLKKYIKKPQKNGECYTVYYLVSNGKVYLSPAQISRSVFKNKVDDILGSHSHCTNPENICPACSLFGMIGNGESKKISALASRVRFSDALIINEPKYIKAILKELAGPKLSSVEFYSSVRNMRLLWNYDSLGIKLNGRKFYFHHNGDYSTSERTGRNMTTQLVDKEAEFEFNVYFDRITDDELHKLVWTLAIGENKIDGEQQHKLGHGKPLGLGSVKIVVESVEKRKFNKEDMSYSIEKINTEKFFSDIPFDDKLKSFEEYMCITNFSYVQNEKVAYPYGKKNGKKSTSEGALVWFSANRNNGKPVRAGSNCTISYYLPKITDRKNLRIPAFIQSDDYGSRSNNNSKNSDRKKENVWSTSNNSEMTNRIRIKEKK